MWPTTGSKNHLARAWHWLATLGRSWQSHSARQLYLRETLALGERRFLAVVEFDQQKFLIAGTGSSVAMLTALPGKRTSPQSSQGSLPAECQEQERVRKDGPHDEAPTWEFSALGRDWQLIRR